MSNRQWIAKKLYDGQWTVHMPNPDAGKAGASYAGEYFGTNAELDEDDAKLIVQAVNAHDELVAALRDALPYLEMAAERYVAGRCVNALQQARAILAKVSS